MSAQRLAASLPSARSRRGVVPASSRAQRLAASLPSARGRARRPRGGGAVLNASRRHCLLHASLIRSAMASRMCSTPRGVTAFCTAPSQPRAYRPPCAQRLAASLPSALGEDGPAGPVQHLRCSTPRGVTAFCTATARATATASGCAQRLAASLPSAHHARRGGRVMAAVLNASRRHCLLHRSNCLGRADLTLCSTPRGVTAFCTLCRHRLRDPPLVLNASRRHCLLHPGRRGVG